MPVEGNWSCTMANLIQSEKKINLYQCSISSEFCKHPAQVGPRVQQLLQPARHRCWLAGIHDRVNI